MAEQAKFTQIAVGFQLTSRGTRQEILYALDEVGHVWKFSERENLWRLMPMQRE
jgi:hypothetical protein